MKLFIEKHWSHLLICLFVIKSQVFQVSYDHVIILGLAALSGYRMYLNSVFGSKVQSQIEDLENNVALLFNSLSEKVDSNHKEVDAAMARVIVANQEEFSKLKTDVGQVSMAQGVGNVKGQKERIFF